MNLKAMIYNVDSTDYEWELLGSLNDADPKKCKTKAALVNYVKSFIQSKTKWVNVTSNLSDIKAAAKEDGFDITIQIPKTVKKEFSFNALIVYDETESGLELFNVQIFSDNINVTKTAMISAITISVTQD